MSIKGLAWTLDQEVKPPTRKLILVIMGDQARECGHCWPSMKRIAEIAGVNRRSIAGHIAALATEEVIGIHEMVRPNKSRSANLYVLPLPDRRDCEADCAAVGGLSGMQPVAYLSDVADDTGAMQPATDLLIPNSNPKIEPLDPFNLPEEYRWAERLQEFPLVIDNPPSAAWLKERGDGRSEVFLRHEVGQFVDYYMAPGTRTLKTWKGALTTWFLRAADRSERSSQRSGFNTAHDPTVKDGECPCALTRCTRLREKATA